MRINMKIARTIAGIKQIQIANELEVSKQTVNKWEMGRAPVAQKHWTRLSELLGMSVSELEAALVQTLLDACLASNSPKPLMNAQVSRQYSQELISEALSRYYDARPTESVPALSEMETVKYERALLERDKRIFELEKQVEELRRELESVRRPHASISSALNIEPIKHEVNHE